MDEEKRLRLVESLSSLVAESRALQTALGLLDIERAGTREASLFFGLAVFVNDIDPDVCERAMAELAETRKAADEEKLKRARSSSFAPPRSAANAPLLPSIMKGKLH